jgi:hypothetical protein
MLLWLSPWRLYLLVQRIRASVLLAFTTWVRTSTL